MSTSLTRTLNTSIRALARDAFAAMLSRPRFLPRLFGMRRTLLRAAALRERNETADFTVPPFLIASVTRTCDLRCPGCYAFAGGMDKKPDMTTAQFSRVFEEAAGLGVSFILLAGGEPFSRKDLLELTAARKDVLFPVFTNGRLITSDVIAALARQPHVLPIVSLEGGEKPTDTRRGEGSWMRTMRLFSDMKRAGLMFGASFTVTRENLDELTSKPFLESLVKKGCAVFFFVEYVPVEQGSEALELTPADRARLLSALDTRLRGRIGALTIAFPGDEEKFGGCLSSGRGFAHIGPDGSLEPCPFAPYSDVNVKDVPLVTALRSKFLSAIRNSPEHLSELGHGCALWHNREWVRSLLPETGENEARDERVV